MVTVLVFTAIRIAIMPAIEQQLKAPGFLSITAILLITIALISLPTANAGGLGLQVGGLHLGYGNHHGHSSNRYGRHHSGKSHRKHYTKGHHSYGYNNHRKHHYSGYRYQSYPYGGRHYRRGYGYVKRRNNYQYDDGSCHRVYKFIYDEYGYRHKIGGTQCYDDYGDGYIVEGSRYRVW